MIVIVFIVTLHDHNLGWVGSVVDSAYWLVVTMLCLLLLLMYEAVNSEG